MRQHFSGDITAELAKNKYNRKIINSDKRKLDGRFKYQLIY